MRLQQDAADPLATVDLDDMSQANKQTFELLTRLSNVVQMSNYLSYGQWDLSDADIERLKKDEEMKQRVRGVQVAMGAPFLYYSLLCPLSSKRGFCHFHIFLMHHRPLGR